MWRSLFLALGIFSLILGLETLVVDKFAMGGGRPLPQIINRDAGSGLNAGLPVQNSTGNFYQQAGYQPYGTTSGYQPYGTTPGTPPKPIATRVVQTRDWMPWSLLGAGALIVLYTHSLPRHHND